MPEFISPERMTPNEQYGITFNGRKSDPSSGIFEERLKNGRLKFSHYVDPSADSLNIEEVVLKPYGLKFFPYKGQAGGRSKQQKTRKTRRTKRTKGTRKH